MPVINEKSSIRQREQSAILACCQQYPRFAEFDITKQESAAAYIEIGINNEAVCQANELGLPAFWDSSEFLELYSAIGYRVKINLDITSSIGQKSSAFIETICDLITRQAASREFARLGSLSEHELNPAINQSYVEEVQTRINQIIEIKYNETYTCPRCRGRKTQVREVQTRAGDEGSTLFITCIYCHQRWKG